MPFLVENPIADNNIHSGSASVNGLTVTPAGRAGDLWVAAYLTVGGVNTHAAPPDGSWSLIADTGNVNNVLRLTVWSRRSNGMALPLAFSHDTGTRRAALSVRAFANAAGVEGTPAAVTGAAVQSVTHTAHTALGRDRLWILVTGKSTAAAGSSAFNTPGEFAELVDLVSAHGTNQNANLAVHTKLVQAGSTGTQLVDSNDAVNREWGGVGFLLKPRNMALPR